MKFEESFNQLKKPLVWLHYALGTLGLYILFKYLIDVSFLTELNLKAIVIFYLSYVIIDRFIHGLLSLT